MNTKLRLCSIKTAVQFDFKKQLNFKSTDIDFADNVINEIIVSSKINFLFSSLIKLFSSAVESLSKSSSVNDCLLFITY